jgi:hypothetical protein
MKRYRKFKRKHKLFHILLVSIAVVTFWWGVSGLLDLYFLDDHPYLSYFLGIFAAFLILFLDDFHLKELQ